MADFGAASSDIGGAVSDLFSAFGAKKAASAYGTAASIAFSNEALTRRSTAITLQQKDIETYKVLGAENADVAGAGFTAGGSAGDLMRASAQQASLSKQLIQNQGEITAQGYEEQAQAYKGQQQAADAQATGSGIGGILKGVAGIAALFSDRRLKQNIKFLRKEGPFNIYSFSYIKDPNVIYEGVMADEVQKIMPEAVEEFGGFLAVNYNMIGQQMRELTSA